MQQSLELIKKRLFLPDTVLVVIWWHRESLIKNAETKELNPCCALMEYFPTDNTADPVERLSEELKKDPFWVKRAQTEKMYTDFYVGDADASDPLCSPAFAKDETLAVFPDCLIISAGEDRP